MLTSRSAAERSVTSSPPIRICPEVAISNPAIRRRVVVLPQPDGPNSVTSVPGSIVNDTLSTARTMPYCFATERNWTEAEAEFIVLPSSLHRNGARCPASETPLSHNRLDQQDYKKHDHDQDGRIGNRETELAGFDATNDVGCRHVPFGGDEED